MSLKFHLTGQAWDSGGEEGSSDAIFCGCGLECMERRHLDQA